MDLSLQPKKFVNSEHMGLYTEVTVATGRNDTQTPLKIHYMEEGSGEPLVLVHTVGQSLYTWRHLISQLAEHYRVIAVDLVGHGYSDGAVGYLYTIEDHVDVLNQLLYKLGVKSAHFIGFSMGCGYVLEFARRFPERTARVVLLSPGGITPQMPLIVRMMYSPLFSAVGSCFINMRQVEAMLMKCFLDLTIVTPDVVTQYFAALSGVYNKYAVRMSIRNYDEDLLISSLREITAPILILNGSEDKWHDDETIEPYHAALPNGAFSLIRNAGHLLHEEKPDKVLAAITEFIPYAVPPEEKAADSE